MRASRFAFRPSPAFVVSAVVLCATGSDVLRAQFELATKQGQVANEQMGCAMAGSGTRWFVGARGAVFFGITGGSVHLMTWSPGAGLQGVPVLGVPNGNFGASIAAMPGGGCIVGEPGAVVPIIGQSGQARILGPTGTQLAIVQGRNGNGSAGTAVANLGDLDGNSVIDCAVGQPQWAWVGCTWYSDWTGSIVVAPSTGVPAIPLTFIDGVSGCPGFSANVDFLGRHAQSICGIGDVVGSGTPEFAVGVTNRDRVDIHGWTATPTPGLVLHRSDAGPSGFGKAICSVGDINSNGIPDYAVGAPNAREVRILEGSTGNLIRSWVAGANEFGCSLALLGDQDGNGTDELIVGAKGSGLDPGEVFIFSLAPGQDRMIAYIKGRSAGSRMGASVCRVPDQTGDGRDEIGVGAPETTVGSAASAGEAVLFTLDPNGPDGGTLGTGCVGVGLVGPEPRVGTPLGLPRRGQSFAFGTMHCQVGALGILALDLAPLTPPVNLSFLPGLSGCSLHVNLAVNGAFVTFSPLSLLSPGLGYGEYTFSIPNNPIFVGVAIYAQAYVADAGLFFPGSMSRASWARVQ